MKAVVVEKKGQPVVVKDVAKPELKDGEVLVKTKAIALNPTDWKHAGFVSEDGSILGCDFAGEVVDSNGSSHVKNGDLIAGFVHGGREGRGAAFAEYVRVDPVQAWKIPSSLKDFEEAAAMGGIAPHTAAQHLYHLHKLPFPTDSGKKFNEPFLIWSGATSVGMYAIQLAKLAGATVITTASEKNFGLLKSLGADDCYSYKDADTPKKIREKYPTLAHALDCIAEGDSSKLCARALGKNGGYVTKLLATQDGDNDGRSDVKVEFVLVYSLLGKSFHMMGDWPADKDQYEFGKKWNAAMPELVSSGKLKSNPLMRESGGLDAVPKGLDKLKSGQVSAQKITYKLE